MQIRPRDEVQPLLAAAEAGVMMLDFGRTLPRGGYARMQAFIWPRAESIVALKTKNYTQHTTHTNSKVASISSSPIVLALFLCFIILY